MRRKIYNVQQTAKNDFNIHNLSFLGEELYNRPVYQYLTEILDIIPANSIFKLSVDISRYDDVYDIVKTIESVCSDIVTDTKKFVLDSVGDPSIGAELLADEYDNGVVLPFFNIIDKTHENVLVEDLMSMRVITDRWLARGLLSVMLAYLISSKISITKVDDEVLTDILYDIILGIMDNIFFGLEEVYPEFREAIERHIEKVISISKNPRMMDFIIRQSEIVKGHIGAGSNIDAIVDFNFSKESTSELNRYFFTFYFINYDKIFY